MRSRVLATLALLPTLLGTRAFAQESCVTCHPDVRAEYELGAHTRQFGCTACHGGDPAVVTTEAHSKDKGYIGKPARLDIPALCATCHADPVRMKGSGLATDQYAQYQASGHGIRLAKGDARVAVCTDCHGTHRILPPQEPTSPVARHNVPATCGRCHSDGKLMAEYQLPADQEEKYRGSVHGIAALVVEHPDAPTCASCHGAHGATAPGVEAIGLICGHCHARTREYFEASPHLKAVAQGAMSECVSCHGYHDIAAPTRALFDTACPACHVPDSAAWAMGQSLKTLLSRAEESLETADREMAEAAKTFPTVVRYRPRLDQARAYLMEALPVQHSLAVERVDDLTRSARSISEEVRAATHGAQQQRQVRLVELAAAWVFLLFTVAVAYLYKRQKRAGRGPDGGGPG